MVPLTLSDALGKTNSTGRYQILLFIVCATFCAQEVIHISLDLLTAKPVPWRYQWESVNISRRTMPPCNQSGVSITSQMDLYCNDIKLTLITTLFFIGRVCGFIFYWNMTVVFGRRRIILLSVWSNSVITWLLSCANSYEVYVVLRTLDGFTMEGYVIGAYILLMECVNEKSRQLYASQFRSLQGFGLMAIAVAAYLSSTWKVLCLVAGCMLTVQGAVASGYLPESPKWQLAKGRGGDVVNFIHKVSMCNGRQIKDPFYVVSPREKAPSESIMEHKEVIHCLICLSFLWFSYFLVQYTLFLNVQYLPGNLYLNIILLGLCDIPGRALPTLLMESIGRKRSLCLYNLLTASSLLGCFYNNNISRCVLYMLAKLLIAGNIVIVKIYTFELSPKDDNSSMFWWCWLVIRLTGVTVPVLLTVNVFGLGWIYVILATVLILSTIFVLFLPETKGLDHKVQNIAEFLDLYYGRNVVSEIVHPYIDGRGCHQKVPYTPDSNTWSSDIDLSAISNTDMGCTSVFDMDCSKNTKLESTRLSELRYPDPLGAKYPDPLGSYSYYNTQQQRPRSLILPKKNGYNNGNQYSTIEQPSLSNRAKLQYKNTRSDTKTRSDDVNTYLGDNTTRSGDYTCSSDYKNNNIRSSDYNNNNTCSDNNTRYDNITRPDNNTRYDNITRSDNNTRYENNKNGNISRSLPRNSTLSRTPSYQSSLDTPSISTDIVSLTPELARTLKRNSNVFMTKEKKDKSVLHLTQV